MGIVVGRKLSPDGECLTLELKERATITNDVNAKMKKYIVLADTTFKERQ